MEYDDRVMCPLIDEKIDPMECVDVVDCVLNPLFLNSLPKKYKAKENFKETLNSLDHQYITDNLSPGGCADLLAVSLMFYFLESAGMIADI